MATSNKNFRVKNGLDVNGEINVSAVGGDEGGQINLAKPATGTTLSGNVAIDIYQDKIRIFDQGGTNRGAYIDLSAAGTGVSSNLLAGGGGGISNVVEDTTPQLGGDLDAQGYDITNLNSLTFDTTPTSPGTAAGTIFWDSGDGIAKAVLNANVTIGLGQESVITVKNATGSTITKGTVVYINGAQGQMPTVALADADTETTSSKTFGFAAEAIADGAEGFIVTEGVLRGVNTDTFTEGDPIYLSTTAGQYTQTIPAEPAHMVFLGYAIKAHVSAGEIVVKIQNGYELTELHGVTIANTAATNDILQLNSSGIWVNANLATAGIANLSGATFTGNVAGTNISMTGNVNAVTVNATTFTGNTLGWATKVNALAGTSGSVAFISGGGTGTGTSGAANVYGNLFFTYNETGQLLTVGNISTGTVTATLFDGSGANLTSIPAANITGTIPAAANLSGATNVGYMGIPQNTNPTPQSGSTYTIQSSDAGKHIYMTTTGRTVNIPANSTTTFEVGTTIVIINATGVTTTIDASTHTIILAGIGTTGTRTLAPFGMATLVKVATSTWVISGNGVS